VGFVAQLRVPLSCTNVKDIAGVGLEPTTPAL
jgi:hypothetical protein